MACLTGPCICGLRSILQFMLQTPSSSCSLIATKASSPLLTTVAAVNHGSCFLFVFSERKVKHHRYLMTRGDVTGHCSMTYLCSAFRRATIVVIATITTSSSSSGGSSNNAKESAFTTLFYSRSYTVLRRRHRLTTYIASIIRNDELTSPFVASCIAPFESFCTVQFLQVSCS